MSITVLSAGSLGDVQPYLALAVALKRAGYKVKLAANSNFATMASQYELDFHPIGVDSFKFVQSKQAQSWLESGSTLRLLQNTNRVIRPTLNTIFEDTWNASQGSKLLIYHSYTLPFVYYFGKHLDIPIIPASIYPMPTRDHPPLPMKMQYGPGNPLNYVGHLLNDHFTWQVFRPVFKKYWQKNGRISFLSPFREILSEQRPILCSYSSVVLPRPADIPPQVEITGYWFLESPPNWQPDPELNAFINTDPRTIYVGFGSTGNPIKNQETLKIVLQALEKTGNRAVITAGWSGMGTDQQLPKNVFWLKNVPFSWLFPRMAAVVHHGGSGTTGIALRSGLPNVIVPHFADQHFWGDRVAALGAGPKPLPRKDLTVDRLVEAIRNTTDSPKYRARAQALGEQIKAEEGTNRAIQTIQKVLER